MEQVQTNRTILSAGCIIAGMLLEDENVAKLIGGKVVAQLTDEIDLPFVVYRRRRLVQDPTKARFGQPCDTAEISVMCLSETPDESLEIAEAVREALDMKTGEWTDPASGQTIRMRSCILTDANEDGGDDAYGNELIFTIKI